MKRYDFESYIAATALVSNKAVGVRLEETGWRVDLLLTPLRQLVLVDDALSDRKGTVMVSVGEWSTCAHFALYQDNPVSEAYVGEKLRLPTRATFLVTTFLNEVIEARQEIEAEDEEFARQNGALP